MRDFQALTRYFGVPARQREKSPKAKAFDKALAGERAKSAAAMKKAKALAELHGVEVERERARAYWVTCAAFESEGTEDPLDGNHFCNDGREVLAAVETYVEAIAKATGSAG